MECVQHATTGDRPAVRVRRPGTVDYLGCWQEMQDFTESRTASTPDEIWFLEHPPVYTLGRNGKDEHLLETGDIPVIRVDRGGQVTYHGPGQLVVYALLDLRRRQLGVQSLVDRLEQSVIDLLAGYAITAERHNGAPGVYVDGCKIAALGLRVRKGCCFHGLSLNVNMDLSPFARINPCGFRGLQVTQLAALGIDTSPARVSHRLQAHLEKLLQD